MPFLYMLSLSLQSDAELFSGVPVLIPDELQFQNYATIWKRAPFGRFIVNSLIIAGGITLLTSFLTLSSDTCCKTELSRKEAYLRTRTVDSDDPILYPDDPPLHHHCKIRVAEYLSRTDHALRHERLRDLPHAPVIAPVPNELLDAARIDGCSEFRIYWQIVLPQVRPALATLALLTFVFQWNEFLWPLVVVSTTEMRPITTG